MAQSQKELADKDFENGKYQLAIAQYQKHLDKKRNAGNKGEVYYKIAESYQSLLQYKEALEWYNRAESAQYDLTAMHYQKGRTLLNLGEYEKAKTSLARFLELQEGDVDAIRLMKSADFALSTKNDPPPFHGFGNEQLINSPQSDYGAYYFNTDIIFTSSRIDAVGGNKTYDVDGQGFSSFYSSSYDNTDKTWKKAKKLEAISSALNDGVFTYSSKSKTAYFGQCSGEKGAFCKIMQAKYDAETGVWTKPEEISYAGKRIEMVHPSVSESGDKLYFVSRNAENGFGGSDIWLLEKKGEGWGEVQIVEGINTTYDEAYPVLHDDNTLYFSSKGYIGMGGLDLFVSEKVNGKWTAPVNLRPPFNSSADDFLLVQKKDKSAGYFSSNRLGGTGSDDIYSFYLKPVDLIVKGNVKDADLGTGLEGATVYLTVNGKAIDSTLTDANGDYQFTLDSDLDYKLKLNKPEYFGDSRGLSTIGEKYSKTFSKDNGYNFDFELMRIPKEEITIEDIYYDYNSFTLRDNSKESLNKLVKLLEDSPEVEVMINSHTDDRGNPKYNLDLSQKRAQSVVDYLIEKGINPARLESKGWGKTALLVKNAKTEEEHQQNRRTTFKVLNQ